MLEHRNRKFTILKLEIKIISLIVYLSGVFPINYCYVFLCLGKYDSVVDDSELFLGLSSSAGGMYTMTEWNMLLFNVNKSSIYLMVVPNLLASIKLLLIKFLM